MDLFQKNCEKWAQTDPQKAILLSYIDCTQLQFETAENGQLNLKTEKQEKTYFFHSTLNPQKEANEWFSTLKLSNIPLLYVYGVGLGYYYQAARAWLHEDPSRRIIFIEDNLAVIHRLFETDGGKQMIHDPQVQLHYFESMEKSKELFTILYWNFFLTTLLVSGLKLYLEIKNNNFDMLQHKLHYDASLKNSLLKEYLDYGVGFFKNFYPNILQLEGSYLADRLFGKFKNIPAIICGAGPSLKKNLSLLHKLSSSALIFAGGSALNALNKAHLQPHFGAAIDPNPPQYDRLSTNTAHEVPFFYRNRLFHQAFQTIHGPKLYVSGSGGYDISHLFEEAVKISGKHLEEGHNVINFCLEIAHALGCNPIIFVGMDLAYTGMKSYAEGVVENNSVNVEEITQTDTIDQTALLKTDIYGQPIFTLWKWMAEAEWIGDFAKENPAVVVINSTEGGLGFPHVPNIPLKEAAEKYLKDSYDFTGMIHTEVLQAALPQVKTPKILRTVKVLQESLQRCIEDLTILIEETNVMKERIKKERKIPFPQQTGKAALFEHELSEEIGYSYLLHIFNEAYTRVLNRELQGLHSGSKRLSDKQLALGKIEILIKRFIFLRDVARVNHELILQALQNFIPPSHSFTLKIPKAIKHKQKRVHGIIEGDSIFYSAHSILAKSHFENGVLEGPLELFYANGELYSLQKYKNGRWHGQQRFFYPNGKLKTILNYREGKLIKADLFRLFDESN